MLTIKQDYGEILSALLDQNHVRVKNEWKSHIKEIKNDFENYFGLVITSPRTNYWTINKKSNINVSGIKFFKSKETYQLFYLACAFLNVNTQSYIALSDIQTKIKEYTIGNLPDLYESNSPFDEFLVRNTKPIIKALEYFNIIEEYNPDDFKDKDETDAAYHCLCKPAEVFIQNPQATAYKGSKNADFKAAMNYLFTNTYLYKYDVPDLYETLQYRMDDVQDAFQLISNNYNEHYNYKLIEKNDYLFVVRNSKNYTAFPSNTNIDKILSHVLINLDINKQYTLTSLANCIKDNELYQKIKIKDSANKLSKDLINIGLNYGFLEDVNESYQPTILKNILKEQEIKEDITNE